MNMTHIKLLLTGHLLLAGNVVFAQNAHFTTSGTVEFNKTVNMYAQIQKEITKDNEAWTQPAFEQFKKNHTQFLVLKSTLKFADNKMLFIPQKADDNPTGGWFDAPMAGQDNTIYSDLSASQNVIQKQVFEQTFLVKDSTRKIKWKITDETRDVAGYTCRRANGIMMDSIYVVAFYTDKIHVSGGPESFNGLPGMILEVALPHENVIWTATKITDINIADNTLIPPKKGKPVNNKQLKATLESVMKNWGDQAQIYLKGFLF
jgi:GLPGLI family protein